MTLRARISPFITQYLTSRKRQARQRRAIERKRKRSGAPHEVHYFHQADDPYSHLLVQALVYFTQAYDVKLVPHLVPPPSDEAAPERQELLVYSRRDAAEIAPYFSLAFEDPGVQPADDSIRLAQRILTLGAKSTEFPEIAVAVGEALWSKDRAKLDAPAQRFGRADDGEVDQALDAGRRQRDVRGHYLGATLYYGGEWYWGVDRLAYLESRLADLGAAKGSAPGLTKPTFETFDGSSKASDITLEYFPSLRSPYTYISFERTYELVGRTGVNLVLRPVLPMVMRGMPVPSDKGRYILLDTKREAESAGVPFGNMSDPLGRPVERAYSLFPWARDKSKGRELLFEFARAAFADGIYTGSDAGLAKVLKRAGLDWNEAKQVVDNDDWRAEFEDNRLAMYAASLWGVPSYRLVHPDGGELATWGQDRIWLIEAKIAEWTNGR